MKTLPQPWTEATLITGWIYDYLLPRAAALKVVQALRLRVIGAARKRNDRIDASKVADRLRCDFLLECYTASTEIGERRYFAVDANYWINETYALFTPL